MTFTPNDIDWTDGYDLGKLENDTHFAYLKRDHEARLPDEDTQCYAPLLLGSSDGSQYRYYHPDHNCDGKVEFQTGDMDEFLANHLFYDFKDKFLHRDNKHIEAVKKIRKWVADAIRCCRSDDGFGHLDWRLSDRDEMVDMYMSQHFAECDCSQSRILLGYIAEIVPIYEGRESGVCQGDGATFNRFYDSKAIHLHYSGEYAGKADPDFDTWQFMLDNYEDILAKAKGDQQATHFYFQQECFAIAVVSKEDCDCDDADDDEDCDCSSDDSVDWIWGHYGEEWSVESINDMLPDTPMQKMRKGE